MVVTSNERKRCGQYSLVRVMALGMAQPSPSPVKKRSVTSQPKLGAKADSRLISPKANTAASSMRLRPSLSPSGPNRMAPAISPASPAKNTHLSWVGNRLHSAWMAGPMKPMAAVSKPSMATIKKHSATISP